MNKLNRDCTSEGPPISGVSRMKRNTPSSPSLSSVQGSSPLPARIARHEIARTR
jgi:hypothetical protein